METFAKINAELTRAMKEKDEIRLSTLRMMKSKILYVNARGDLPEPEVIKILTRFGKELKEEIDEAKKVGRLDVSDKTEKELKIVEEYLPKQLSPEEIKTAVQSVISSSGAASIKDMGRIMKDVLAQHPGIDGKLVNQFVRELLK
jgi:hypothetical protein